jgi:hypothetical protein
VARRKLSGLGTHLIQREVWTSAVTTNSTAEYLGNIVFGLPDTVCQRHGGLVKSECFFDDGYYLPKRTLTALQTLQNGHCISSRACVDMVVYRSFSRVTCLHEIHERLRMTGDAGDADEWKRVSPPLACRKGETWQDF